MISSLLVSASLKEQIDSNIKCSDEFDELYKLSFFHNFYLITNYKLETDRVAFKRIELKYFNKDKVLKEYENAKIFFEKNTSITPIQDALGVWLKSIGREYSGPIDFACEKLILKEIVE